MTRKYSIVFELEESGAVSACVPGLPLYAAADTAEEAQEAVLGVLVSYVEDRATRGLELPEPQADVKVARVATAHGRPRVGIAGPSALLGHQRSARKAAAARRNGQRGGRPASSARR